MMNNMNSLNGSCAEVNRDSNLKDDELDSKLGDSLNLHNKTRTNRTYQRIRTFTDENAFNKWFIEESSIWTKRVHNQSGGITLYDCRYCRKSGYNCAKKLRVIKSKKFPKIYIETTPDDHDHEPKCVLTKGMKLTPEAKNLILALYDECEKPAQILKELLPYYEGKEEQAPDLKQIQNYVARIKRQNIQVPNVSMSEIDNLDYKEDQPEVSPHPDPEVLAASAPYSQHTLHLPSRFFLPKTKAHYNQKPNPSFVPIVDMMDTSMDGFNEANGDGNILNDVQAIESDYKQHQSINNNYSTTSPNSSKGIQKSGVSVKRKQIDSESHFFGRFVASKLSTVADPHIRTKVQMRIMKVFDDLPSHSYVNAQNQLLELDECYDNDGF